MGWWPVFYFVCGVWFGIGLMLLFRAVAEFEKGSE